MFCRNCGAVIDGDKDNYCYSCGVRVGLNKPSGPRGDFLGADHERSQSDEIEYESSILNAEENESVPGDSGGLLNFEDNGFDADRRDGEPDPVDKASEQSTVGEKAEGRAVALDRDGSESDGLQGGVRQPEMNLEGKKLYPKSPSGFGGLLLFFTIWFFVVSPLWSIGTMANEVYSVESQYPGLFEDQTWNNFKTTNYLIVFAQLFVFLYAAHLLRSSRKKSTVSKVLAVVWVGGLGVNCFVAIIPFIFYEGGIYAAQEVFGGLVVSFIWSSVFSFYMLSSRRVSNTYVL